MRVHQTVMLGAGGVGKSALTVQMVHQRVVDSYDPTIEDSYRTNVMRVDGEACLLEILDTAGQEQYTSLTDSYIRTGESFALVYALTDHASFLECKDLYQQILRIKDALGAGVAVVLVGNKSDLEAEREVETAEGQQLAAAWSCPFFETSAKQNLNVRESFFALVRQCRQHEPPASTQPGSMFPREGRDGGYGGGGGGRRRRRTRGKCTIL